MIVFPNAKINIGLYVTARRKDGYHDISSVFYPISLCDVLEVVEAPRFKIEQSGEVLDSKPEDNLVAKAYRLLQRKHKLPECEIYLHKHIPAGSGLGGGSSDAAHLIIMANQMWELGMNEEELMATAMEIGSDCGFFIRNTPQHVSGRGEVMEPIDLQLDGKWLTLIMPEYHMSTKEAYAHISVAPASIHYLEHLKNPIMYWPQGIENDFEAYAFEKYPSMIGLKSGMYRCGAEYVQLSGSGMAMYAISDATLDIDWEGMGVRVWEMPLGIIKEA